MRRLSATTALAPPGHLSSAILTRYSGVNGIEPLALRERAKADIVMLEIRLARLNEAELIAVMSRDLIENGLGWTWTPSRVAESIRHTDTNVVVADTNGLKVGFAIMHFGTEHAHLDLLAVAPTRRRLGVGRQLIDWLEKTALVAGTPIISLEVRARNRAAQAFYGKLGYRTVATLPRYYGGVESAIRMARDLWEPSMANTRDTS